MEKMIEGIKVKQLKVLPDERGRLMEILRNDDELFEKFGQVYLTTVYSGVIKAWHKHKYQNDNIAVVKGMIKLVMCDLREGSKTYGVINEIFVGKHNPLLVHIPEGVYHGFKGISEEEALIINIPTNIYNYTNPDELRLPFDTDKIPYNWERKNC